jgi:hypothetical protein
MLVSTKLETDFSWGCEGKAISILLAAPLPHSILTQLFEPVTLGAVVLNILRVVLQNHLKHS